MQEDMTPQELPMGEMANVPVPEPTVPQTEDCVKERGEYIPTYQEAIREYEIGIRFLSRGCVIRVGCKEIPFEKIDEAMNELQFYVAYPYEAQKKWRKILK